MARGLFRKPSFNKIVGAYRSQWKRALLRLLTFGAYGSKGMGWLRDPKKAWYNWWYHRTSISIPRLLGYRPSRGAFFCAMLIASAISIFTAPVDIAQAGTKAHKIRKAHRTRPKQKQSTSAASPKPATKNTTSTKSDVDHIPHKSATAHSASKSSNKPTATKPEKPTIQMNYTPVSSPKPQRKANIPTSPDLFLHTPVKPVTSMDPLNQRTTESSEDTPKSRPKHENDQYIRKRMIIAGSAYCDQAALEKLTIGTYFDLVADSGNEAIMLVHDGEKIGYVAKQDALVYITCLRLNRKVYGVITDIITDASPTKYEFETWFDKSRSTES